MLEVGTKAPDFELFDQDGKLHKLSDYIGKRLFYIFIQRIVHRDVQSKHVDFLKDILSLQRKEQLSLGSVRIQWLLIKNL